MIDKEKIVVSAQATINMLSARQFTADENVAFIKSLEHVLQTRAIEKDLVVASLKMIKEVCAGRAPIESLLPKGKPN